MNNHLLDLLRLRSSIQERQIKKLKSYLEEILLLLPADSPARDKVLDALCRYY